MDIVSTFFDDHVAADSKKLKSLENLKNSWTFLDFENQDAVVIMNDEKSFFFQENKEKDEPVY